MRRILNRVADSRFVYACVLFLIVIVIVYVGFYACVLVVIVHACLLFLILVFGDDVGNVYENGLGEGLVNFVQMKKRKFQFRRSEMKMHVMLIFSKELVLVQLHAMCKVCVALYLCSNCLNRFDKKEEISFVFFLLFCHVIFLWFFQGDLTSFFFFACFRVNYLQKYSASEFARLDKLVFAAKKIKIKIELINFFENRVKNRVKNRELKLRLKTIV